MSCYYDYTSGQTKCDNSGTYASKTSADTSNTNNAMSLLSYPVKAFNSMFSSNNEPANAIPLLTGNESQEDAYRSLANLAIQQYNDSLQPGLFGMTSKDWGTFGTLTQGLGTLANIYGGFQQLDMAKDQLDIAKDQWATTKAELARINSVRDKLNAQYTGA